MCTDHIKIKEVVGQIVQKSTPEIIKEELKNKLKVKTTIKFPHSFSDGSLVTEVIYGGETINTSIQKLTTGSTIFAF